MLYRSDEDCIVCFGCKKKKQYQHRASSSFIQHKPHLSSSISTLFLYTLCHPLRMLSTKIQSPTSRTQPSSSKDASQPHQSRISLTDCPAFQLCRTFNHTKDCDPCDNGYLFSPGMGLPAPRILPSQQSCTKSEFGLLRGTE